MMKSWHSHYINQGSEQTRVNPNQVFHFEHFLMNIDVNEIFFGMILLRFPCTFF